MTIEKVTKENMIEAANTVKAFLSKNHHTDAEIAEYEKAIKMAGQAPAVKKIIDDSYDARMTHKGFGSPDCSCHANPPCQSCVDWTNFCDEREIAVEINGEPGCTVIEHGCDADGVA